MLVFAHYRGTVVFEIIQAGGWVMVPLLMTAITALAIVGNRLWVLRRQRLVPAQLTSEIEKLLHQGDMQGAYQCLDALDTPLATILRTALNRIGLARKHIKEAVEETGRHEVAVLDRHLNILGTIAAVSPLMGLLGTVFGIMHAFDALGASGTGNPGLLASGISEALVTTATGLIIAIPSLMMYRYFRAQVDELVLLMEKESLRIVELIQADGR